MAKYTKTAWHAGRLITRNDMEKIEDQFEMITPGATNVAENYKSSETYSKGDYCLYDGELWKCIATPVGTDEEKKPKDNSTYWTKTKIMNETNSGISQSIANEYKENQNYEIGDYVTYHTDLYRCIETTHGAWNSQKWELVILSNDITDLISVQNQQPDNDVNKIWIKKTGDSEVTLLTKDEIEENYCKMDTIAPTFSASTEYAAGAYVYYYGALYRFITDHTAGAWTGTDVAGAVIGQSVSELKSDISDFAEEIEASANLFPGVYTSGKSLNADGTLSDNSGRAVTDFIPVEAETSYYTHYGLTQGLVNFIRVNCYGPDQTTVLSSTINTNTFTTTVGTEYIRICSTSAYFDLYYSLTDTSDQNPYVEYHPKKWVVKTDSTFTDEYLPAEAKATGAAIAALGENVNTIVGNLTDDLEYIGELKTNVYVHKEPINIMPSIQHNTNILEDGTTEVNNSYAASSKFAVKPNKKIVFTRQMTSTTRGVERFKAVFFNGDTVISADTAMSDAARSVPNTATHAIVGFYESYATDTYAPMVEYGDGTNIAQEYSEYFAPFNNYKPSATQRNSSKKLCVFGDSLAANGNGGNEYWAYITGTVLGFAEIYNRGVGSSRVADTATLYAWINSAGDSYNRGAYASEPADVPAEYSTQIDACMSGNDRALTIPLDTDVLLILAGANDAATIGTIGIEAFKTAYGLMLDKIYNRVPNAKIYLCTPPFNANWDMGESAATYQSIRTAVVDMGQQYGYPIIDLKGEMMVNKNNYEDCMNEDGVHFNTANGRKIIAEAVIPHLYGYIYL